MKTSHPTAEETVINNQAPLDNQPTALARRTTPAMPSKRALTFGALAAGALALVLRRLFKSGPKTEETVLHVVPNQEEGWEVKGENDGAPEASFETKKEALDSARDKARANEPSRLVVHGQDGEIQRSHTYDSN